MRYQNTTDYYYESGVNILGGFANATLRRMEDGLEISSQEFIAPTGDRRGLEKIAIELVKCVSGAVTMLRTETATPAQQVVLEVSTVVG